MNKVNWTVLGGAPIANEDWDFQDAGIRDAFKNFASFLGTDFYVSGGWDGTNYQTGIVCLGGEIFQITNSGVSGAYVYIEPNIAADPGGDRIFEDSSVPNIWEARTAQYNVYTTVQTGKVLANTLTNAYTIINQMVNTFPHIFTKRQTFAKMDAALVGGADNTIDVSAANVVKCELGSGTGTANLVGFTNGLENSTVYWCYASGVDVLVKPLGNISTPFSQNYLFKAGEWFSFVVVDGAYCLKTDKANKVNKSVFIADFGYYKASFSPPHQSPHIMASITTPADGITRFYKIEISVGLGVTGDDGALGQCDCNVKIKQGSTVLNKVELQSWTTNDGSGHYTKNVNWSAHCKVVNVQLGPGTQIDFEVEDVFSNGGTQVVTGYATMEEWIEN